MLTKALRSNGTVIEPLSLITHGSFSKMRASVSALIPGSMLLSERRNRRFLGLIVLRLNISIAIGLSFTPKKRTRPQDASMGLDRGS
jgi:cyanate permease